MGNRLRKPVFESGAVSEATPAIRISNHAGRAFKIASTPMQISAVRAMR
jgi:hypothetical protein